MAISIYIPLVQHPRFCQRQGPAFIWCCGIVQIRQGQRSHSTHCDLRRNPHEVGEWVTSPPGTGDHLTCQLNVHSKQDGMMVSTGDTVTCHLYMSRLRQLRVMKLLGFGSRVCTSKRIQNDVCSQERKPLTQQPLRKCMLLMSPVRGGLFNAHHSA